MFYTAFNSISVISWQQLTLFMSFLGFTSTRPGSEVSCPRTLPRKKPEDPVRLETRTPGLQVKHFTTEPLRTLTEMKFPAKEGLSTQSPVFFCEKDSIMKIMYLQIVIRNAYVVPSFGLVDKKK